MAEPSRASARVILKRGREGPVRGRNPWIFSQAIESLEPCQLEPGAPVEVFSHGGDLLGAGYYHPSTTIAIRMLAFGSSAPLAEVVASRVANAIELRRRVIPA